MNTFFKQFSCFLFIVTFSTCSKIEARDSEFFSKYAHTSRNNENYVTVPSIVQSSSPTPAPSPLTSQINNAPKPLGSEIGDMPVLPPTPVESENAYYGIYGKGCSSNQFHLETTTTTATTTPRIEVGDDEFSTEEFRMENSNELNSR